MSPVSRARKPRKSAKRPKNAAGATAAGHGSSRAAPSPFARPESAIAVLRRTFGSKERPGWFDDAIMQVLDGADALLTANGPRELEQRTGFGYPRATDLHILLLDIDTSAFIVLADVGIFDEVEQAAAAWRATVGDSAENAQPERVTDPDQLMCLVHVDPPDECGVRGDEPRSVLDNWFRADCRIRRLHDALRKRRMPLPGHTDLYRNVDIALLTVPFVEWYAAVHGTEPGTEAVESLAEQWMEGALPETWFDVSPRRVEYQLTLVSDWIPDEVTTEVQILMPEWVRWLGERAGLPAHLLDRVVAGADPETFTPPEFDTAI